MALFNRQKKKARKAETNPEEPQVAAQHADQPEQAPAPDPPPVIAPPVVDGAPAAPADEPASPDQAISEGPTSQHETLPAALEPELRSIIDTAVARVAAIELDAIRQSRALTQRTEEEGREALRYALDRALELVKSFELLTVTIAGMVDALRVELDETMAALREVPEPQSELSRELDARSAAAAESPTAIEAPAPVSAQPEPQPEPAPSMNGAQIEPSPEMEDMFRERIRAMREGGKTRQEAERSLLRFNLGRRYVWLLDEIYDDEIAPTPASANGQRRGRVRSFFTR